MKPLGVKSINKLTPNSKILYKTAIKLKNIARRLYAENTSNKKRLKEAMNFANCEEMFSKKINKPTLNFLISQIKMQSKHPRGRRFSLDDKIFTLALMKQSPKGYRLLQKVFALPSRKTLMAVLNRVPFGCGLNQQILKVLEASVLRKKPINRNCILTFDEMSLTPSLNYSKSDDSVVGFVNCGEGKRLEFADHAMVFMLRGVAEKWKQPVAYFFTQGAMKTAEIMRNLKIIISKLNEIGFDIIATVCDQLSANRSAINQLIADTKADYLRKGQEKRNVGFEVNGKEIVPLFDTPHMLKQIRNHLVENNAEFTIKGVTYTARWEDFIRLFEMDNTRDVSRMVYNLTAQHVYPNQLRKMKVKHAAQVLSQKVGGLMKWTIDHGK